MAIPPIRITEKTIIFGTVGSMCLSNPIDRNIKMDIPIRNRPNNERRNFFMCYVLVCCNGYS